MRNINWSGTTSSGHVDDDENSISTVHDESVCTRIYLTAPRVIVGTRQGVEDEEATGSITHNAGDLAFRGLYLAWIRSCWHA